METLSTDNEHPLTQPPPQSIEAEERVLAAIMSKNSLIIDLDLDCVDFYVKDHQTIFNGMKSLEMARRPIDTTTLADILPDMAAVEKMIYIFSHWSATSTGNVSHYAKIVRERAIERRLLSSAYETIALAYDRSQGLTERLTKAQKLVMEADTTSKAESKDFNYYLKSAVQEIDQRFRNKGKLVGLATGFVDIDRATNGLRGGDMVIVAGRPSMGKTTFALNIAENVAMADGVVMFLSLEMGGTDLTLKVMASVGGIDYGRIQSGQLHDDEWDKITVAAGKLKDKHLRIDTDVRIKSNQIASRARHLEREVGRPVDLIVIDYLQLVDDKNSEGETNRITDISRNIKLAAMDLNIPVIALSQLNRSLESRPDKRPLMSDLRQSGAIEQDASVVIMMYREEVYDENTMCKGIAEAIIRKSRWGKIQTVHLTSELDKSRFRSFAGEIPKTEIIEHKKEKDYFDKAF